MSASQTRTICALSLMRCLLVNYCIAIAPHQILCFNPVRYDYNLTSPLCDRSGSCICIDPYRSHSHSFGLTMARSWFNTSNLYTIHLGLQQGSFRCESGVELMMLETIDRRYAFCACMGI